MKKLIALFLLAALAFSACQSSPSSDDSLDSDTDSESQDISSVSESEEQQPVDPVIDIFALSYNGIRLIPGEVTDVVALLGEPEEQYEAPSCVHDGNDIVYSYSHFEVTTSPSAEGDYISSITVYAESVKLEEGIGLGDNIADVIAICPDYTESFGRYTFTRKNTTLILMTDDNGIIIAISYGCSEA